MTLRPIWADGVQKGFACRLSLECHHRDRPGGANDGKKGDKFTLFFIIRSTATRAVVARFAYCGYFERIR